MKRRKRAGLWIAAATAASALAALGAGSVAARSAGRTDTGTIYAATTHTAGGYIYTAGQGTDKLFGPIAISYRIKAQQTTPGTFHLTVKPVIEYTATGSILGTASATLTIGSKGAATITNGKVSLKHGTGSLAGHSLVGTFTGTGNATTGQYVFNYKDKYR